MGKRAIIFILIILIIILYCITWRTAYCAVPDTTSAAKPALQIDRAKAKEAAVDQNAVLPITPAPAEHPEEHSRTQKKIPRPAGENLKPFGYDLFSDSTLKFPAAESFSAPDDYPLGPGDHVLVNVWGRVDLNLDLIVDPEGKVFIPRAGETIVHGATRPEAEKRIRAALGRVYSDFEMNVTLGPLRPISVFVFGEVRRPGAYTVTPLDAVCHRRDGDPDQRCD